MALGPTVLAPFQQAGLEVGEPLPEPGWFGPDGREFPFRSDRYVGRRTVLVICGSARDPVAEAEIRRFSQDAERLADRGVQVFVITPHPPGDNAETARRLGLAVPLLTDPVFSTGRSLGVAEASGEAGIVAVVLNVNRRVEAILRGEPGRDLASRVLEILESGNAKEPTSVVSGPVAPVLVVPNLLSGDHCARLIRYWEAGEQHRGTVASGTGRDGLLNADVKVRTDVFLSNEGPEAQELVSIFRRRLFPEIAKAFKFRVTRSESFRIGSYDSGENGHFRLHRDDRTPRTYHRRFAMSLNLNTGEYEGGTLRFPEYGDQLFDVARGSAVIFSCGLLHEAMPVTAGRRMGMFAFFYGEADERERRRRNPAAPEAMLVDRPGE